MELFKKLLKEEIGATAVEYAIMVGLIAIVIVVAVQLVGTNLNSLYEFFVTEMEWD